MATFGSAVFVAGPYSVTFNSVAVGLMRGDENMPLVEQVRRSQLIKNTHLYAETPIGAVGQGGEAFAQFTLMEYIASALAVFWPYSTIGKIPSVGYDDYNSFCNSLVFTAASGTLAASTPASLTCPKAVIKEDHPMRITLGPRLREIPMVLRLYPNDNSNMQHFTVA